MLSSGKSGSRVQGDGCMTRQEFYPTKRQCQHVYKQHARIFNILKRLQQEHFIQPKMLPKTITVRLPAIHFRHWWFCLSSLNIPADQVSEQQPTVNCCQAMAYVPFSRSAPEVLFSALWFLDPAPFSTKKMLLLA